MSFDECAKSVKTDESYYRQGAPTQPFKQRTAWDALNQLASAARLRANQLEVLQRSLPQELPHVADEALRDIFDQEYARFHRF